LSLVKSASCIRKPLLYPSELRGHGDEANQLTPASATSTKGSLLQSTLAAWPGLRLKPTIVRRLGTLSFRPDIEQLDGLLEYPAKLILLDTATAPVPSTPPFPRTRQRR